MCCLPQGQDEGVLALARQGEYISRPRPKPASGHTGAALHPAPGSGTARPVGLTALAESRGKVIMVQGSGVVKPGRALLSVSPSIISHRFVIISQNMIIHG